MRTSRPKNLTLHHISSVRRNKQIKSSKVFLEVCGRLTPFKGNAIKYQQGVCDPSKKLLFIYIYIKREICLLAIILK